MARTTIENFVFDFFLSTISIMWAGWTASILWTWFAVPLGAKPIVLWHAVGLGILLSSFLGARGISLEDRRSFREKTAAAMLLQTYALGFGWLAKCGM